LRRFVERSGVTRIGSRPETRRYGLRGGLPALRLLADALGDGGRMTLPPTGGI
jgi:hypothetical protein